MSTPILPSNRPDSTLPTARGDRIFRRSLSGLACRPSVPDALYGAADFPTVQREEVASTHVDDQLRLA